MKSARVKGLGHAVRVLISRESLGEPDGVAGAARESFAAWLMKAEELPLDEPRPARSRRSLRSLIFSAESLPREEPAPAAGHRAGRPGSGAVGGSGR